MTTTARLSDHQIKVLLSPVNRKRVSVLRGMSHMEAWDIRRQLIRIFGFGGYSTETLGLDLVHERSELRRKRNKQGQEYGDPYTAWTIVYRAQVRLTIFDTAGRPIGSWDDGAAGDSVNQPSVGDAHDMAMKTALSQALKRCATNLGDQFGLSLYNAGDTEPVVNWSAAHPPKPTNGSQPDPELPDDAPVRPEPQPSPREHDSAPAPAAGPEAEPAHDQASEQADAARPRPPAGEDPDEWEAAAAAMWDAAREVGFRDGLPGQFANSFGHPIEQGTTAEYRQARDLMTGSTV